jgi:hypothetical protein
MTYKNFFLNKSKNAEFHADFKMQKRLKKWKTFFYKHVLEFNYATINGLVHPSC